MPYGSGPQLAAAEAALLDQLAASIVTLAFAHFGPELGVMAAMAMVDPSLRPAFEAELAALADPDPDATEAQRIAELYQDAAAEYADAEGGN